MSWRDKLDQNAQEKIEEHWPKVQQIFQEKIGPAALAAASNDDKMRSLFKLAYEAIPFPWTDGDQERGIRAILFLS